MVTMRKCLQTQDEVLIGIHLAGKQTILRAAEPGKTVELRFFDGTRRTVGIDSGVAQQCAICIARSNCDAYPIDRGHAFSKRINHPSQRRVVARIGALLRCRRKADTDPANVAVLHDAKPKIGLSVADPTLAWRK